MAHVTSDRELTSVVTDGFDRDVFERALGRDSSLAAAAEALGRLLPHAEALLSDIFCALYKLNVVLRPPEELSPAVVIHRQLLDSVMASSALQTLRRRTFLDRPRSTAATVLLAERLLHALKREYRHYAEELLELAEVARDEERIDELDRELEHLEKVEELDDDTKAALAEGLSEDLADLLARRERGAEKRSAVVERLQEKVEESVELKLGILPDQLDDALSHTHDLGVGGDGQVSAERRLELGERIMRSRKLQLLAKLVGAFREVAFEARRKRVVRSPQVVHAVTTGDDLERLLPAELLGLRASDGGGASRALRVDFLRRFTERQLMQYRLHAPAARGPMVICVDGSGSMQGAKELWAKAVALTLMEIARRDHRRCLAMIFSSGHEPFTVELLGRARSRGGAAGRRSSGRGVVRDEEVLRFAENFPGGGTDFEQPLRRALDAVISGDYRRGDIVFITDGQASVSAELLERIVRERKKHRFKIRGILVDVGEAEARSLERFADDVRMVTDLAADSLSDLFASI